MTADGRSPHWLGGCRIGARASGRGGHADLRARTHLVREAAIRAGSAAGQVDPERFDAVLRAKGLPV
ncbi:hypothetical protein AX767_04530 [Variovorax sp. PAMC 28711]|nr:hypothetical protein AX767_04530 [Variovorax sp. PAMC 28711]